MVPLFTVAGAYRALRLAMSVAGLTPDAAVLYTEWAELCLYLGLVGLAAVAYASTCPVRRGRHAPVDQFARPLPPSPVTSSLLLMVAACTLLATVLAVLTMFSSVRPGNV